MLVLFLLCALGERLSVLGFLMCVQLSLGSRKLSLDLESASYKNYVALYLIPEDKAGSQLPLSSGVMVDAVLSGNWIFGILPTKMNLSVNPMGSKSGNTCTGPEKHLSLSLAADIWSLSPDDMIETKFKFFIQDQKEGKHIEREASHTYMKPSSLCRTSWMIPLKMLKSPSLGFLVNDSIEVGVEFSEIKKLERTCFIPKNKSSGLFRWYIDDFSKLSRPIALSKPFQIAGYTWKLRLEPESIVSKHFIGLYLIMENKTGSKLPPSSGVMVQATFYIKRQSLGILADGSLRNKSRDPYQYKLGYNFTPSSTSWGTRKFIRLQDFKYPSNGYLINGACTIEASVCIFGSGNDHSS
ncbi:Ubiquitin carboxyl-terminal hydrolase 13 [Carex littledalei]|uniref:Ubiquitin carboxyl-terminal hydrolase 13 n=1 Tax=Carex littledalei TaxID=544730 RepID=A0A833VJF4_9POAL|nr:Ubiquitin carboxyl-terminal hydrolase 13 [Carex littledalei]